MQHIYETTDADPICGTIKVIKKDTYDDLGIVISQGDENIFFYTESMVREVIQALTQLLGEHQLQGRAQ